MSSFQIILSILLFVHSLRANPLLTASRNAIEANNEFGFTFFQTLINEENTFFSPLSLTTSLITLINSANGQTLKELRESLGLTDQAKTDDLTNELKTILSSLKKKADMKVLSRVVVNSDENSLKEEFVKKVDFNDVINVVINNDLRKELNQWFSDQTNQRIHKILDSIDPKSSVLLTTGAYFSGKWKHSWKSVGKDDFYNLVSYSNLIPGLPTKMPFMSQQNEFRVENSSELRSQLIELPLSEDQFSMFILLPNSNADLEYVNDNITSNQLNVAIEHLLKQTAQPVRILLPKFKLENEYDLKETLEEFGVKTLFTGADLSNGVTYKTEPKVSVALHKATIEVNEEGTDDKGLDKVENEIKINKPFVFVIRDNSNGLIVFIGKVHTLVDEEFLSFGFI